MPTGVLERLTWLFWCLLQSTLCAEFFRSARQRNVQIQIEPIAYFARVNVKRYVLCDDNKSLSSVSPVVDRT